VEHILKVYEKSSFKNVTGQIYNILNNNNDNPINNFLNFWEIDIGITVTAMRGNYWFDFLEHL